MTTKLTIFARDVSNSNKDITYSIYPASQEAITSDGIVLPLLNQTTTNGRADVDLIPTSRIDNGVQYILEVKGGTSYQFSMPDTDANFADILSSGNFTIPTNNGLELLSIISAGLRTQGVIQQGQVLAWQPDRSGINQLVVSTVSGSIEQLINQGTNLPATTGIGRLFLLTRDEGANKQGLYVSYAVDTWTLYSDLDRISDWAFKANTDTIPLTKLGRETILSRVAGTYAQGTTQNVVVRVNARTLSIKQDSSGFFGNLDNFAGNTLSLSFAGWSHEILTARNFQEHNGQDYTTITVGVDLPTLTTGTTYQIGFIKPEYTAAQDLKLKGIEDGAEQNIQSDWNTTDSTDDSYIENKPDVITHNEVIPFIRGLSGNDRLSYSWLKDTPSNADIKRQYEANLNTNAFTDNEKTKVDLLDVRDITSIEIGANKVITLKYLNGQGSGEQVATGTLSFLTLEEIQDAVSDMIRVGGSISRQYNDSAGTLTLTGTNRDWFRGAFASGTSYQSGDIVVYSNVVYIAVADNTGAINPQQDTTNWLDLTLDAGLSSVHTDTTLTGTGTGTDPLKVAIPFTQQEKTKLDGIQTGAHQNVGLEFTQDDKNKLDSVADGAEVNVNSDWNASSGDAEILNKPDITPQTLASQLNALQGADRLDYDSLKDTPTPLTNAQIKAQYEANNDTNAFTDTDKGVLDSAITTLRAGSNITITGTGRARTINSTGGGGGSTVAPRTPSTDIPDIADTADGTSLYWQTNYNLIQYHLQSGHTHRK